MLVSSVGATSVSAASSTSGKLGGVSCYASVAYVTNSSGTNNGARALTSFGASTNSIKATAYVYYYDAHGNTRHKSASNSSTAGGTSATAYADGLGTVCGGKGLHYVKYGDYEWSPTTTIGSTS